MEANNSYKKEKSDTLRINSSEVHKFTIPNLV